MVIGPDRDRQLIQAEFYKNIKEKNPGLVIFLIVVSLGLYIISWIYMQTKQLNLVDDDAPDPRRGAALLMLLPVGWYFANYIGKKLIFQDATSTGFYVFFEMTIWLILFLLVLKYLYDFSNSFSKVTRTNGMVWFVFLMLGFLGLFGYGIGNKYLFPLVGILIITIPAMQAEVNSFAKAFRMKRYDKSFYDH